MNLDTANKKYLSFVNTHKLDKESGLFFIKTGFKHEKYSLGLRDMYLDHNYFHCNSFIRAIGDFDERYIFFKDYDKVIIDPWELIKRDFRSSLKLYKETLADHIFFNLAYALNSYQFEKYKFTILKLLEFAQLFPTEFTSQFNSGISKINQTQIVFEPQGSICLHCGAPIKASTKKQNYGAYFPMFCDGEKGKQNTDHFQYFSRSALAKILTMQNPYSYKNVIELHRFAENITESIIKHINKIEKKNLNIKKYQRGYQSILGDDIISIIDSDYVHLLLKELELEHTRELKHTSLKPEIVFKVLERKYKIQYNKELRMNWLKFVLQRFTVEQEIYSAAKILKSTP